jgi:hypothetical protein
MAEENQKQAVPPEELNFSKKNGTEIDNNDDEHDLFKSAIEVRIVMNFIINVIFWRVHFLTEMLASIIV